MPRGLGVRSGASFGGVEEGLWGSELKAYCVALGEQLCYDGVQGQPRFVVMGGYYGSHGTETGTYAFEISAAIAGQCAVNCCS
jgi:hypothetical protein